MLFPVTNTKFALLSQYCEIDSRALWPYKAGDERDGGGVGGPGIEEHISPSWWIWFIFYGALNTAQIVWAANDVENVADTACEHSIPFRRWKGGKRGKGRDGKGGKESLRKNFWNISEILEVWSIPPVSKSKTVCGGGMQVKFIWVNTESFSLSLASFIQYEQTRDSGTKQLDW